MKKYTMSITLAKAISDLVELHRYDDEMTDGIIKEFEPIHEAWAESYKDVYEVEITPPELHYLSELLYNYGDEILNLNELNVYRRELNNIIEDYGVMCTGFSESEYIVYNEDDINYIYEVFDIENDHSFIDVGAGKVCGTIESRNILFNHVLEAHAKHVKEPKSGLVSTTISCDLLIKAYKILFNM